MGKTVVLVGFFFMAIPLAQAADNGIYVGVSIGQATLEDKEQFASNLGTVDFHFDQDDLGYKVLAGIRPLDWLGFEANYVNFGEQEQDVSIGGSIDGSVEIEGYGLAGYVVGFIPIGPVDIFGKAGIVSWDTKGKFDAAGAVSDWVREDGEDLAYGIGVQFRLLSLGLRAEYEVYDIEGLEDANLLSIGVTYTFL